MQARGLILDFAGVLAIGIKEAHTRWCRSEGLDPDAWRRTLEDNPEGRRLYKALESGVLTQQEWNRATAALLGVADHVNLMGRVWAGVRPAEDMISLARQARAAGLTVAMLSNSFGLDPYDPYAHVWDLFDLAVISEREGIAKPDPEIYRRTVDRMGLPPESLVFVDDNAANLPPARELGITAVHADGQPGAAARVAAVLGLDMTAARAL